MQRLLRIAAREYLSYIRTPGFWLSLMIGPGMGVLSGYIPILVEKSAPARTIAVVDYAHAGDLLVHTLRDGPGPHPLHLVAPPPEVAASTTPEQARAALQPYLAGDKTLPDGQKLTAAVILTGTPDALSMDLWARQINDPTLSATVRQAGTQVVRSQVLARLGLDPAKLMQVEQATPNLREFSPRASSGGRITSKDQWPTFAAFGLSFLLWSLVVTGASILLSSVIEEKSNRVLEVLLTSASVNEILVGKILGVALLAATILLMWAGGGYFALQRLASPGVTHDVIAAVLSHGLIFEFAAFFVLGYLMYASIFVAIGSFCETPREAQTLVGPIMIILILPILFLSTAIRRPDSPVLQWLAWFPPFTPFLMTSRVAAGAPWWEIVGTLVLMIATSVGVMWISARAFRAGALSTAKFDLQIFFQGIRNAGR